MKPQNAAKELSARLSIVEYYLVFPIIGTIRPYQAEARLRPRLAKAHRLALAKSAYNLFSFFVSPL